VRKAEAARGFVSLVGAGPGDPDLLTRRAVARLDQADIVFHDALVDPAVRALAPRARHVFVGKRAGRPASQQEFINRLMIRAAARGLRVVRLKGGDPFVFGRGGEEALALARAGVAFEVVPGVTSAVAAAELAGIPVTHRGLASAFVVVAGHSADSYRAVLDGLTPHAVTIVVMMGLRTIDGIASGLIERGWNPQTPAAVVIGASTADQNVRTTTLAALRLGLDRPSNSPPGTIVIGDVVRIRAMLTAVGTVPEPFEESPWRPRPIATSAAASGPRSPTKRRSTSSSPS
jgi:uroporphyrin-III C-methyltransferase/precorrin-2 dehydrogenase/sirohydrochlorin ferrochelatase